MRTAIALGLLLCGGVAEARTLDEAKARPPKYSFVSALGRQEAVNCVLRDQPPAQVMPGEQHTDVVFMVQWYRTAIVTVTDIEGGVRVDSWGQAARGILRTRACMGLPEEPGDRRAPLLG